uniref:NADH dehydrogenase subunit 6 n=1 Tax=Echinochasmus japonicus TaxID=1197313 RepID=A0A186QDL5_9TREM|nr:NADH dehydrogenase subunit 6 [Echinochasmus japonicus]AKL39066.1 NADH dehydrogenase subunit 6 [Echinochasmus japonicus]
MLGVLISLYFSCLVGFSLVSHPVIYCVMLLIAALSVSGVVYLMIGFSWYLALFCLVYIGGVYVLFIFVSVHCPNANTTVGGSVFWALLFFIACLCMCGVSFLPQPGEVEFSYYLCSFFEGFTYCLFCLVLLVGFICISVVYSSKDSFFR